ncbi:hypothetical protein K5I29_04220 [Flavobacterium agricola]|uniref:Uncharacterized protein n=1 Tax=Flavobacterium agricola TaxID=2870839 RepID=A0ABY6M3U1_9FLAO|nr:hypothetical protein [Flavobacterium agricola]UYW02113.1 hypothetical protein K5I29_04220 [Flavobacterium agricola]
MIYDELDVLPLKLYYKICKTKDVTLLSTEPADEVKLLEIWQRLTAEYEELESSESSKREFRLNKQISLLECAYNMVHLCCVELEVNIDNETIQMLNDLGFMVDTTSNELYYASISKIRKRIETNQIKIAALKNQLPKEEIKGNERKVNLDEVMASFCAILGIDFDYNTISVTKFNAIKKQVDNKMKSYEKMSNKINGK